MGCCCKAGFSRTISGSTVQCSACLAGKTKCDSERSTCTDCTPGRYATGTGSSAPCKACEAGKFALSPGATACTVCPLGHYQDAVGKDGCKQCPAGKYTTATAKTALADCLACPQGRSWPLFGPTRVCSVCSNGHYQDQEGQATCKKCAAGKSHASTEKKLESDCVVCAKGKFAALAGAGSCTPCANGKYQAEEGKSVCIDCAAGKFTDGDTKMASTDCKKCPAGKYAGQGHGGIICTNCAAGKWSLEEQGSCTACAAGTTVASGAGTAANTCKSCANAAETPQPSGLCAVCGAGKQAEAGKSGCQDCPAGKFSDDNTACKTCATAQGHFIPKAKNACTKCPQGRFSTGGTAAILDAGCKACPKGQSHATALTGETDNSNCAACAAGKYNDADSDDGTVARLCKDCTPTNAKLSTAITCTDCPAGKTGTGRANTAASCID